MHRWTTRDLGVPLTAEGLDPSPRFEAIPSARGGTAKRHRLYYSPDSAVAVGAALSVVELLGLHAVQLQKVDTRAFAEHSLDVSPLGELPALVHGQTGRVVYGPVVLVELLQDLLDGEDSDERGRRILPARSDPIGRARSRMWAGWCRTAHHYQLAKLHTCLVTGPALRDQHASVEAARGGFSGTAADLAEATWMAGDEGHRGEAYASELRTRAETLERELTQRQGFLAGPELSLADCFAAAVVEQADALGVDVTTGLPRLQEWRLAVRSRPGLAPLLDELRASSRPVVTRGCR